MQPYECSFAIYRRFVSNTWQKLIGSTVSFSNDRVLFQTVFILSNCTLIHDTVYAMIQKFKTILRTHANFIITIIINDIKNTCRSMHLVSIVQCVSPLSIYAVNSYINIQIIWFHICSGEQRERPFCYWPVIENLAQIGVIQVSDCISL